MKNSMTGNKMNRGVKTLVVSLALVLGAAPALAGAAGYLKIGDIKGESNGRASTPGKVAQPKPTPKPGLLLPAVQPARSTTAMPGNVQVQKADYTILSVNKVGGKPNQFGVQIKNIGQVAGHGGQLSGANMGAGGGSASTPMPPIKAGEHQFVFITFNNSSFNRGDRIRFHADSSNAISESNEGNNQKYYSWQ
jgi:hypothetical protein